MAKALSTIKLLLVQIRADNLAADHERKCILEMTGLDFTQLDSVNIATTGPIDAERYSQADAILIGGSASHSAVNDDVFTEWFSKDIQRLADEGKPILGSCWGHQFVARALGGEVVHDPQKGEVGVLDAWSTDAVVDDPVFGHCPETYPVLMGHHDRVERLPEGAIELAYSDLSRNQAFRLDGRPVYGTQFHAELTPDQLIERLSTFRQYMPDDDEFEELKSKVRPTPEASMILPRFLDTILEG